ncbi:hypothetical protein BC830DRAFT_1102601 [Chytriomyces sp. MP71]|nr:hypothetical protein BC830DRAFT_1102601 [Chytriomyces sp. MP71]
MLAQSIASSVHPNTTVSETQRGTAPVPKRRRSPDAVTDPEPHADGRESATPASRIEASDVQSDTNGAAGIKRMRADAASPAAGARGKVDGQRYTGVNALLHLSHAAAREKRRMEVLSGGDVRESGGVKQERGLQLLEEELAVERHYAAMNSLLFQLSKERGRVWDL